MTTAAGGDYGSGSGTSFAVPVVTGMAALVISANSALTGVEAMNILKQSTDDLGAPGWDATYGSGRVNALKAVLAAISAGAIDSTAPTAQITSPASGAVVFGSVMINVTASYNVGVAGVALYINSGSAGSSASASASFAWDTEQYANGSYTLQVRASDAAGNTGDSAVVTVTVQNVVPDTTPPLVSITSPAGGTKVTLKSTPVTVSSSDNVKVARVDLFVNGKRYATSTSATPTFNWNTSKLRAGTYTLHSVAYDAAGNSTKSSDVIVEMVVLKVKTSHSVDTLLAYYR